MPTGTPTAAEFVARWTPLAVGLARRAVCRAPWLDQCFESAALVALWRLGQQVESGTLVLREGNGVVSLIYQAVGWALLDRLKSERARNAAAFTPQTTGADDDAISLLDRADEEAYRRRAADPRDAAEELAKLLDRARLTGRERDVLDRLYGRGETAKEVAAALGCTPERIAQIEQAARAKARAAAAR